MSALLENFHFIRPGCLLLAPVAAGIGWLWVRQSDPLRGWREQIDPELLNALVVGRESMHRGPAIGLAVAWLLAIIGIAGPTWRLEPSPFSDDATPLMVLLKADASMDQPDPAPSRLERAQLKISDLADARKGQPLGLIAYAGSAHMVLPPTRDTAVVAQMAAEISPAIMPVPGDRLDLALREAVRVLADGDQGGCIVVLADSAAVDPATARQFTQLGWALVLVFAMRMAAIFVFTTTALGRRHRFLPRWFILVGHAVGAFLLLSASFAPFLILVFPAWLLILGVLILVRARSGLRRTTSDPA